jgi:hypothetical protein
LADLIGDITPKAVYHIKRHIATRQKPEKEVLGFSKNFFKCRLRSDHARFILNYNEHINRGREKTGPARTKKENGGH